MKTKIILALVLGLASVSCSSTQQQRSCPPSQQVMQGGQQQRCDNTAGGRGDTAPAINSPGEVRNAGGGYKEKVRVGKRYFAFNHNLLAVTNDRTGETIYVTPEQLQEMKKGKPEGTYHNDGSHPAFRDLKRNPLNPFGVD